MGLTSSNSYSNNDVNSIYAFNNEVELVKQRKESDYVLNEIIAYAVHMIGWVYYRQFSCTVKLEKVPISIKNLMIYCFNKSYPVKNKVWLIFILFFRNLINFIFRFI